MTMKTIVICKTERKRKRQETLKMSILRMKTMTMTVLATRRKSFRSRQSKDVEIQK